MKKQVSDFVKKYYDGYTQYSGNRRTMYIHCKKYHNNALAQQDILKLFGYGLPFKLV